MRSPTNGQDYALCTAGTAAGGCALMSDGGFSYSSGCTSSVRELAIAGAHVTWRCLPPTHPRVLAPMSPAQCLFNSNNPDYAPPPCPADQGRFCPHDQGYYTCFSIQGSCQPQSAGWIPRCSNQCLFEGGNATPPAPVSTLPPPPPTQPQPSPPPPPPASVASPPPPSPPPPSPAGSPPPPSPPPPSPAPPPPPPSPSPPSPPPPRPPAPPAKPSGRVKVLGSAEYINVPEAAKSNVVDVSIATGAGLVNCYSPYYVGGCTLMAALRDNGKVVVWGDFPVQTQDGSYSSPGPAVANVPCSILYNDSPYFNCPTDERAVSIKAGGGNFILAVTDTGKVSVRT